MPLKHTVKKVNLKNGIEGLFINVPDATSVYYDISFRAGNDYVRDDSISQAAHIMEHMAFGPNEKFDSMEQFSQEFSRNGAYHNARTGSVSLSYMASCAIMEWDRILDLQLLAITRPVHTQLTLDAEKGNVREELNSYANNHGRILWQEFVRQAGLKRWYDPNEIKTLEAITLKDIQEHYRATHTTRNMQFVVAGDLQKQEASIISRFEALKLPVGKKLALAKDHPHSTGLVQLMRPDLPSLRFMLTFFLRRKLTNLEMYNIGVLNYILTGGLHSRILGKARARGVCYDTGSYFSASPSGMSDFGFDGNVAPANMTALANIICDEMLAIIKNGITKEELAYAKSCRLGRLQMGTETVASLVNWYAPDFYENSPIELVSEAPAMINAITADGIHRLVTEFIDSGIWGFGVIGNCPPKDAAAYEAIFAERLVKRVK